MLQILSLVHAAGLNFLFHTKVFKIYLSSFSSLLLFVGNHQNIRGKARDKEETKAAAAAAEAIAVTLYFNIMGTILQYYNVQTTI
jgi:hypothetical protein